MALNQVSVVPAGVLRVISGGFLTPTRAFSKGPPTIFRKHMPWGMGTESLGMIGCIFAENGPLEGGIESNFSGTGWGAKGDLWRICGEPRKTTSFSVVLNCVSWPVLAPIVEKLRPDSQKMCQFHLNMSIDGHLRRHGVTSSPMMSSTSKILFRG